MIVIRVIIGMITGLAIIESLSKLEEGKKENKYYIFALIVYTLIEIVVIKGGS